MFFRSIMVKVLLFVLWSSSAFALSISVGEQIENGGFQTTGTAAPTLTHWTVTPTSSSAVNARLSSNTINTSGGNMGFNGFFGSPFVVLGDNSGQVGSTPDAGTYSISQTFELLSFTDDALALPVESYDLVISFKTVFDGSDANTISTINPLLDNFYAILTWAGGQTELFSQNSLNFPTALAANSANNQLANNPFTTSLFGLSPGSYTLTFSLFENNGVGVRATNTAAGIDDVSVMATANIAVVPEPATLLLLGGGLALLPLFGRRNRRR